MTLRFDEETTTLESYEVVCLMHAPPAAAVQIIHVYLTQGVGRGAGVGWLVMVNYPNFGSYLHSHMQKLVEKKGR